MPDVQEVFRMATQKVRPDPGALDRQHRDQRWRVAKKKTAVFALVAAIAVAGIVIGINVLPSDDVGQPAATGSTPTPVPTPTAIPLADPDRPSHPAALWRPGLTSSPRSIPTSTRRTGSRSAVPEGYQGPLGMDAS